MYNRCPGREGRNLQVEVLKCPSCGCDVEIFSDEMRFRCKKCGTMVVRKEIDSTCIEWCKSAQRRPVQTQTEEEPEEEASE